MCNSTHLSDSSSLCTSRLYAQFQMAPSAVSRWYQKVAEFNVESLFSRKPPPGPPRSVFVNENLPEDYFDHKHRPKKDYIFSSNQVITSKYTIITFLPRNLLEQFRRIANVCVVTSGFFANIDGAPFVASSLGLRSYSSSPSSAQSRQVWSSFPCSLYWV